jgi:hypothetical protein
MREGEPWGEWLQTSKDDWCGEGALQVKDEAPAAPLVVEAELGKMIFDPTESMVVNKKAYNQLRGDVAIGRERVAELVTRVDKLIKRENELLEAAKADDRMISELRSRLAKIESSKPDEGFALHKLAPIAKEKRTPRKPK